MTITQKVIKLKKKVYFYGGEGGILLLLLLLLLYISRATNATLMKLLGFLKIPKIANKV